MKKNIILVLTLSSILYACGRESEEKESESKIINLPMEILDKAKIVEDAFENFR
ncbi:MAG: hypothetical protein AAGB35_02845 [Pseudomonadota bacterium]